MKRPCYSHLIDKETENVKELNNFWSVTKLEIAKVGLKSRFV